jgi:hypothetical protein
MGYSKYGARKVETDGILFDSIAERNRYQDLKLLQQAGEIKDLELQVKFPLIVNDMKVATYIADFVYRECSNNQVVVEDVKGFRTPEYRLKKKLMLAIYSISIFETGGTR